MEDKTGNMNIRAITRAIVREFRRMADMNPKALISLLWTTVSEWMNDNAARMAAALSYYSLLSTAPLLVVVIAVAGLAYGEDAVRGQIFWQLQDLIGAEGAKAVEMMLKGAQKPATGIFASILGLITLFFGASWVVAELKSALNTIWKVAPPQGESTLGSVFTMLRNRVFSFALVMGIGFLLIVSLVVSAWLAAIGEFFQQWLPVPAALLTFANFLISFVVITFLFTLIYRILPDTRIAWGDVVVGATVTSLLFSFGKYLIGLYLGRSSFTSTYGAVGSLVIFMVWVYYSAQIFFLGAEFTKVYAAKHGSKQARKTREKLVPTESQGPPAAGELSPNR
ncbi:MAG: YihY/virulence factor BrkB family protein [Bryobacterales bacterium]|nr:YihY/virulence factor BrkB family protein [Bryobacterales bacterium]